MVAAFWQKKSSDYHNWNIKSKQIQEEAIATEISIVPMINLLSYNNVHDNSNGLTKKFWNSNRFKVLMEERNKLITFTNQTQQITIY